MNREEGAFGETREGNLNKTQSQDRDGELMVYHAPREAVVIPTVRQMAQQRGSQEVRRILYRVVGEPFVRDSFNSQRSPHFLKFQFTQGHG